MAYNPGYVDGKLVATNAAYVSGLGLFKVFDTVEGGITYWVYLTSDSLAAVQVTGYISDAGFKRMKVGDIVDVFSGTVVSESNTSPAGITLGLATFAFTTGILGRFTTQPQYQRMMVSAVTQPAGTNAANTSSVGTLTGVEPSASGFGNLPRNLLDCGDFTTNPWQIATSFNGSSATPTLTADRWNANAGGSQVWTAGRTANTTVQGFSASYVWGRSAGDTHTVGQTFGQVIETQDSVRAQGLPVTLSFWCAADANFAAGASGGTFIASVLAGTGIDDTSGKMFSGSWTGMTTVGTQVIAPTSTMTRYQGIGGVVPTNATQLGVAFSYVPTTAATSPGLTAGAHESLQFMGLQLESGGTTVFEHTEAAEVVNIATRYLQVISEPTAGIAIGPAAFSSATIAVVHIPLPSPMRKAPTFTFTAGGFTIVDQGQTGHAVTSAGLTGATTGALTVQATCSGTFSAGNSASPTFMQGRSTGLGSVVLNADY